MLAASAEIPAATVLNIGGGAMTSLSSVIATVERLLGRTVPLERSGPAVGDAAYDRRRHDARQAATWAGSPESR